MTAISASMFRAVAATIAAAIVFVGMAVGGPGQAVAGGCPTVANYAVGGNGDPTSTHVPRVPAGWRMNITYPADVFQGDYSRQVVRDKLTREARAMRASCPSTHIRVVAYSLGAAGASQAVDAWQTSAVLSSNTSAVFVGNPRHPRGADGWGGIELAGLPNIPGIYTWTGVRRGGPIPVTEICNARKDIICSSPLPLHRDLIGAWNALYGYATGDHLY